MSLFKKTIFASQTRKLVANVVYRTYSSQEGIPEFESLAVSVPKQHVFHVELNRPDKLNTFSHSMWGELKQCFLSLSENPECRVVVLSGRGKHFTAGIDLNDFMKQGMVAQDIDDVARKAKYFNRMIGLYQDGITALEDCAKPVFAVVHNACVGAGVDLITAADVRYCTEEAWFQVKEVDVGLAADVGTLQRLPKVVGSSSVVRELCYTARKFQAKEALQIGLVSKVFANQEKALEHVLQVAEEVAAKSPVAVQVTKQSLVYSQSRPTKDGLDHIRIINQAMLQNEDLTKSAMAAVTKEKAEFENL